MVYIIEDVILYQSEKLVKTSMVIRDSLITLINAPINHMKYMRMNLNNYIMSPIQCRMAKDPWKRATGIYEQYVLQGTGIIIIPIYVPYEYLLGDYIKHARRKMKDSPLDYVLTLSVPLKLVKPELMLFCKKEKIPAVFIEVDDIDAFKQVPWSRIRQYSSSYNPVFIPVWQLPLPDIQTQCDQMWTKILTKEKLHHLKTCPSEGETLELDILKKIGIYPVRGYLQGNRELSYNLYCADPEISRLNGISSPEYDKLVVTVLKGKVIRAGSLLSLSEATGEELQIKVPGFFT